MTDKKANREGYCVTTSVENKKQRKFEIHAVQALVCNSGTNEEFLPCTNMTKFDNEKMTYRVIVNEGGGDMGNKYVRVLVVYFTEHLVEAENFVASQKGRRIKVPNIKKVSPLIRFSPKGRVSKKLGVLSEHEEVKAKKKKDNEHQLLSSKESQDTLRECYARTKLQHLTPEEKVSKDCEMKNLVQAKAKSANESDEENTAYNKSSINIKTSKFRSIGDNGKIKITHEPHIHNYMHMRLRNGPSTVAGYGDEPTESLADDIQPWAPSPLKVPQADEKNSDAIIEMTSKQRTDTDYPFHTHDDSDMSSSYSDTNPAANQITTGIRDVNANCALLDEQYTLKVKACIGDNDCRTSQPRGLENAGTTCYVNCLLQSLNAVTEFWTAILLASQMENPDSQLVLILASYFIDLDNGTNIVKTTEITKFLESRKFEHSSQQDPHELLCFLLEELNKEIENTEMEGNLTSMFVGSQTRTIINRFDRSVMVACTEPFQQLHLNITESSDIYDSLRVYFQPYLLEKPEKVTATSGESEEMESIITLESLPRVLVIHLLRFDYSSVKNKVTKLYDRYKIYDKINMREFVQNDDTLDCEYLLQSVIAHRGTANEGHYVTFVDRYCSKNWYKFDDETVTPCTEEAAIKDNYGTSKEQSESHQQLWTAYMLVYIDRSYLNDELQIGSAKNAPRERKWDENSDFERPLTKSFSAGKTSINVQNEGMDFSQDTNTILSSPEKAEKKVKGLRKDCSKKKSMASTTIVESQTCEDTKCTLHKACCKKILQAVSKMERLMLRLPSVSVPGNEIVDDNDVKESSLQPDAAGKITTIDGLRVNCHAYTKACDQDNMRKRVNWIMEALWSRTKRLKLTVEKRFRNGYKRITSEEFENVRSKLTRDIRYMYEDARDMLNGMPVLK